MTFQEVFQRTIAFIRPCVPAAVATIVVTVAVVLCLSVLVAGLRFDQKRFRWLGLLYNLSILDCLRIACYWLNLVLVCIYMAAFRSLTSVDYLLLMIPGVLGAIRFHSLLRSLGNILWLGVELAALFSTNLVCGFIHEYSSGMGMLVLYVCMCLFTCLLQVFLFINSLSDISERRQPFIHEEE